MDCFTYLALGDSYSIGEQVLLSENFPSQTVQILRKKTGTVPGLPAMMNITAPEIIAKTGWTTGELLSAINESTFLPVYDMVSLLIGVNNQYRGLDIELFKTEFGELLQRAIQFAGGRQKNVFVFSIPDWGITPFAEGKDQEKIAREIDEYNAVCKNVSALNHCNFINITESQREDNLLTGFLATDQLHPSGKEYRKWAEKLAQAFLELSQ